MKKFLPFVLFALVFAIVLAGQVGYKMFAKNEEVLSAGAEYQRYESMFLNGQYKTLEGKNVKITDLNSPVVIYNFWASWCIPCLEEMPSMIALKKKFKDDDIKIVAFNSDEENQIENIQKTKKKINLKDEFIIVPDVGAKIVTEFDISAIPVTIIFNRGRVVHVSNGPMDFASEEIIEKMKKWIAL